METIVKPDAWRGVPPALVDYDAAAGFSWAEARRRLAPAQRLNIAAVALDRQLAWAAATSPRCAASTATAR